jgi:uncharacterized protein YbjQ (UPF0145 family)
MTTLSYARNGQTYAVEVESLPPTAIHYLLQYGWAQSLQDSIAGREKKVKEEFIDQLRAKALEELGQGATEADADDLVLEQLDEGEIRTAQVQDIHGQLQKRMDAIIAGTVGTRSVGEPRDPLKAVAADMIRTKAKATGVKFTKEQLAEKVATVLANDAQRAKVQAEYDARKARGADVDLDI